MSLRPHSPAQPSALQAAPAHPLTFQTWLVERSLLLTLLYISCPMAVDFATCRVCMAYTFNSEWLIGYLCAPSISAAFTERSTR